MSNWKHKFNIATDFFSSAIMIFDTKNTIVLSGDNKNLKNKAPLCFNLNPLFVYEYISNSSTLNLLLKKHKIMKSCRAINYHNRSTPRFHLQPTHQAIAILKVTLQFSLK